MPGSLRGREVRCSEVEVHGSCQGRLGRNGVPAPRVVRGRSKCVDCGVYPLVSGPRGRRSGRGTTGRVDPLEAGLRGSVVPTEGVTPDTLGFGTPEGEGVPGLQLPWVGRQSGDTSTFTGDLDLLGSVGTVTDRWSSVCLDLQGVPLLPSYLLRGGGVRGAVPVSGLGEPHTTWEGALQPVPPRGVSRGTRDSASGQGSSARDSAIGPPHLSVPPSRPAEWPTLGPAEPHQG